MLTPASNRVWRSHLQHQSCAVCAQPRTRLEPGLAVPLLPAPRQPRATPRLRSRGQLRLWHSAEARRAASRVHAQGEPDSGAGASTGSGSYSEEAWEEEEDRASGGFRVRRLVALAGAVALELLVTGSLVWTPLAAAAFALLVLPAARAASEAAAAAATAEAVRRAEARVRAEMAARQAVSPPESAVWMSRMLGEFWGSYVTPMLLSENLGAWADRLRRAAPSGWELELVHLSMGRQAPSMGSYQVFSDPSSGRVTALECEVSLDSPTLRAVVRGSGPVGRFTASVAGVRMKGRMRMLPFPEHRLLLFSFREPPDMDVDIRVKGPVIGERSLSSSSLPPLRSALAAALAESLVEPRRGAISLDSEVTIGQPIDTIFNIYVESVQGLHADSGAGAQQAQHAQPPQAPAAAAAGGTSPAEKRETQPSGQQQQQQQQQQQHQDGQPAAAAAGAANGTEHSDGGGTTSAVVAAASHAAAAAGEAVVEGAGAIASLVPGLAAVAGDGGKKRKRRLQVVAVNTDSKLQRATRPVAYSLPPPASVSSGAAHAPPSAAAPPGGSASPPPSAGDGSHGSHGSHGSGVCVPVQQLLRLNVGHKDGIFKLTVRNAGRGSDSSASSAPPSPGPAPASAPVVAASGSGSVLGCVYLHVAAAKDGSSLFWAAREGGEPVVVRWRPSDGPWRVTLPLESPTLGLPPPPPSPDLSAAGDGGEGRRQDAGDADAAANGGDSSRNGAAGAGSSPASSSPPGQPSSGARSASADGGGSSPAEEAQAAGAVLRGRRGSAASAASSWGPSSGARGGEARGAAAAGGVGGGGGGPSITLLLSTDPWVYKDASPPGAAQDSPRQRSLVLQLVEARDLAARDWAGTCDPYVRLAYDGRSYRSRTLYNAHHPVWQQTFILRDNPSLLTRRVSLSLFDSGVSRDDSLGSASLNLDMASEHGLQDRWLPLQGVESGWLRVRLAAVPDAPDSDAVQRMVAALEGLTRGSGPLLAVSVLGARALSPRPVDQLLGMRDAYVNVLYGGARHVTHVAKQSQNPRWEYTALFPMPPEEEEVEAAAPAEGTAAGAREEAGLRAEGRADASADGDDGAEGGQNGDAASAKQRQAGGSGEAGGRPPGPASPSIPLPPYPRVPGLEAAPSAASPAPPASTSRHHAQPTPTPQAVPRLRLSRDRRPGGAAAAGSGVLRLEVKDVDPVPPDDDLGWVELDVRALLPAPGDSWSGWLPLTRGDGAELQVRVSRLAPLPLPGEGLLRLPGEGLHAEPAPHGSDGGGLAAAAANGGGVGGGGGGGGGAARAEGASIALPRAASQPAAQATAAAAGVGAEAGAGAGGSAPPAPALQRVLLDSFTDQVRAGNRSASQMGEDLRVRLGQDVIPKMQDWWDGTLRRTSASLSAPADKMADWLRAGGLSAWVAGANAMAGRPPPPAPPQPPKALPPGSAASAPERVASAQQREGQAGEGEGGGASGDGRRASGGGPAAGAAGGTAVPGGAPSSVGDAKGSGGGPVNGQGTQSGPARSAAGGGAAASRSGSGSGSGSSSRSRSGSSREGGLRGLVSRTWEQLLGPPPALQLQQPPQQQQQQQGGEER